MILQVLILTASILKVVGSTDGPLYVFRDPTCKIHKGEIKVTVIDLLPPDPTERVGYLTQDGKQCDVFEVVYPGV